jgi:RNA polymerase subunit RPABC4/transcription elongation factor Spt4
MTRPPDETGADHPDEQQRVRVCPECSEIVDFDERICPACQHHDPLLEFPALGAETRACEACGEQMLHSLVFCPRCGAERDAVPRSVRPEQQEDLPDNRDARPYITAAWVLTLLGPLVMLAAVLSVYL